MKNARSGSPSGHARIACGQGGLVMAANPRAPVVLNRLAVDFGRSQPTRTGATRWAELLARQAGHACRAWGFPEQSRNPRSESARRGWAALGACAPFAPREAGEHFSVRDNRIAAASH